MNIPKSKCLISTIESFIDTSKIIDKDYKRRRKRKKTLLKNINLKIILLK